jgi:hypothetical protein
MCRSDNGQRTGMAHEFTTPQDVRMTAVLVVSCAGTSKREPMT